MNDKRSEGEGDLALLHVRRLVIEAVTPLSPASGEEGVAQDMFLTCDMNGLPQLYGPTLAGVLRHHYRDHFGKKEEEGLFGHIEHGKDEGAESRLEISFGFVHGADDRPVTGLLPDTQIKNDAVLRFLRQEAPLKRDRVRLDGRGVAVDTGKFDRVLIPAGTRFTLELVLEGNEADGEQDAALLDRVVALWQTPYLRLGGGARQAGRVRIVGTDTDDGDPALWRGCFDRRSKDGWQAYKQWRNTPLAKGAEAAGLVKMVALPALAKESIRKPHEISLTLKPEDFWSFGAGRALLGGEKPADSAPLHETVISYENGGEQLRSFREGDVIQAPFVASGLKGALAHRAEFHLNRQRGIWAEALSEGNLEARLAGQKRGMDALFGSLKASGEGCAGCLFVDDVYVSIPNGDKDGKVGRQEHNSIDRFTQGVRNHVLFSEEMLFETGELTVELCLLTTVWDEEKKAFAPLPDDVLQAFAEALDDLCAGRLAVGGRHVGFFTGSWNEKKPLLKPLVDDAHNRKAA